MLELNNIRKEYKEFELKNINLKVDEGEFLAGFGAFRLRQDDTSKINSRSG